MIEQQKYPKRLAPDTTGECVVTNIVAWGGTSRPLGDLSDNLEQPGDRCGIKACSIRHEAI